jgi:hypothetical protein
MSPGDAPSIRHANFVAITYSSRRPLIARSRFFIASPRSCATVFPAIVQQSHTLR